MKIMTRALLGVLLSLLPIVAFADIHRIDWSLSGLDLGASVVNPYTLVRLDIESGDRYFPAAGALYPAADGAPIYPVSGTCIYQPSGLVKCNLQFEKGALVIEVGANLSGDYKLVGYSGEITHTGTVLYSGIAQ